MELKTATRKKVKLKLNISAPSGAGKTMGALLMAKGLVGEWPKIAVIDTENRSASLYSHLGDFLTIDLSAPYSPERYIEAIDMCLKNGIECIIIDSSSHEWSGAGGCLEMNEKTAHARFKGNTWSAWSDTTPRHDAFVNKMLQSDCHIITCTRSKMETVMGDDKKVKKLGMKDIQRDNWEYELTVSLSIDRDTHMAIASKDRTNVFEKKDPFVITEETGKLIKAWCDTGIKEVIAPAPVREVKTNGKQPIADTSIANAKTELNLATSFSELKAEWVKLPKEVKANKEIIALKDELKNKIMPQHS